LSEQVFWKQLEAVSLWKRRNLPLLTMPQGAEVVAWLMQSGARPRPLKELYAASRFSEPTVRTVIQSLADRNLVVFQCDDSDQRVRLVRPSPKLVDMLEDYVAKIRVCVAKIVPEHASETAIGAATKYDPSGNARAEEREIVERTWR
jgi:DNA-binding MarR family transcriptional regulator